MGKIDAYGTPPLTHCPVSLKGFRTAMLPTKPSSPGLDPGSGACLYAESVSQSTREIQGADVSDCRKEPR